MVNNCIYVFRINNRLKIELVDILSIICFKFIGFLVFRNIINVGSVKRVVCRWVINLVFCFLVFGLGN